MDTMIEKNEMEQVVIPHNYFLNMSKKDYSDYGTALIREFFQNSVDAGAENFNMNIQTSDYSFTVTDDGCGMNEEVLRNKLFVLGESHKDNSNAIGAFGHAKLLLYFSWENWQIRTQDILVTGKANYFKIEKVDEYFKGTKSTIWMPESVHHNLKWSIDTYFKYCNTGCKVTLIYNNNEPKFIDQGCYTNELIFEGESFNIYQGINLKGWNMLIRQNGLLMFQQYIGGSCETNMPILEIKKTPTEMLMQSRDYFKKPYDQIISKVTNQLASESIGAFKILNEGSRGVSVYSNDDIFCKISKPYSVDLNNVLSYEMVHVDALKLLSQKRTLRLLAICESYYKYMINNDLNLNTDITFGITKGMDGLCKKVDNGYQIFINIDSVTKHSPDYRKMSVILFNIIKHELAHAKMAEEHKGDMQHDHRFVRCYDAILDQFWDTVPITNIFKQTWKEF